MSETETSESATPRETRPSGEDEVRTLDGESLLWSASPGHGAIGLRRGRSGIVPGAMCGRYLIVSRLGAGGMGEVYRAYDLSLGRSVAIKVLRSADENCSASEQEERATKMVEEAQILARLAHENIVPVYEIGKIQNEIYTASAIRSLED